MNSEPNFLWKTVSWRNQKLFGDEGLSKTTLSGFDKKVSGSTHWAFPQEALGQITLSGFVTRLAIIIF